VAGETPQAFADRLWPVYASTCGVDPDRDHLRGADRARWLRILVANCLPRLRAKAELWFDPRDPQITEEAVIRQLFLAFRNAWGEEKAPKGKVREVKPPQERREWHQERGASHYPHKGFVFRCGKMGHWRKDCPNSPKSR